MRYNNASSKSCRALFQSAMSSRSSCSSVVVTTKQTRNHHNASITAIQSTGSIMSSYQNQIQNQIHTYAATNSLSTSSTSSLTFQKRYNSSGSGSGSNQKQALAARDTRMAGRRRFYESVDVIPLDCPPWEQKQQKQKQKEEEKEKTNDNTKNVNPISAGVDGTNSATGISNDLSVLTSHILQKALTPPSHTNNNNNNQWYTVTLDGKSLRTPLGTPLALPSLPLALSIASEWDDQKTYIQPAQMPLMTLTCTALDQLSMPSVRADIINQLMEYLKNDTTCYWTDGVEDRVMFRRQKKHWDQLHNWVSSSTSSTTTTNNDEMNDGQDMFKDGGGLGVTPSIALGANEGLIISRKRKGGKSYVGLPHPNEVLDKGKEFLESLDAWSLTAMQSVTMEAKSFFIGMAVIQAARAGTTSGSGTSPVANPYTEDVSKAIMASRVEEEFQIEHWGLVEGGHDYDRLNCSITIYTATVLVSSMNGKH